MSPNEANFLLCYRKLFNSEGRKVHKSRFFILSVYILSLVLSITKLFLMKLKQNNSGSLRQMSITESFKYIKPKALKMEKPFNITSVCIEIDSDSDLETSQQSDYCTDNSPSKKLKLSNEVDKPDGSNLGSQLSNSGTSCLNLLADSIKSNGSDETIEYWDEDTVEFSLEVTRKLNEEELIMNESQNCEKTDGFNLSSQMNQNEDKNKSTKKGHFSEISKKDTVNIISDHQISSEGILKSAHHENLSHPGPSGTSCVNYPTTYQMLTSSRKTILTKKKIRKRIRERQVDRDNNMNDNQTSNVISNTNHQDRTCSPESLGIGNSRTTLAEKKISDQDELVHNHIASPISNGSNPKQTNKNSDNSSRDNTNSNFTMSEKNKSMNNKAERQERTSNSKENIDSTNRPSTSCPVTPEKQIMSPEKNTSPKKNQSPYKNREIKSLKSKEGKQLQVRQLDELEKLFKMVLSHVHLKFLLEENERSILTKFLSMEENVKYVVSKLFVFKRQFYNIYQFCSKAKIVYSDDKDINDIFEYLREESFIDSDYRSNTGFEELLEIIDAPTIKKVMEEMKIPTKNSKSENVSTILKQTRYQSTLTSRKTLKDLILDKIEQKFGFAFQLKENVSNAFYKIFLLGTFANRELKDIQTYFERIIFDKAVYPETLVENQVIFKSINNFRDYCEALNLRRELDGYMEDKPNENKSMAIYNVGKQAYEKLSYIVAVNEENEEASNEDMMTIFTGQYVYCKILSVCSVQLKTKQNGRPEEVKKWLEFLIKYFPKSKKIGKWYHTLIWLHMRHLKDINYKLATELLIEILDEKRYMLSEIDKHLLGQHGKNLIRSKKHKIYQMDHDRVVSIIPRSIDTNDFPRIEIDSQCIRSEIPGQKRKYISKKNGETTIKYVEQVALEYYSQNGYPGGDHCEGQIIKALLMLFFWDIIYNPPRVVPGAFISKLQSAPLDMFSSQFYENRKDLIDTRLKEIRTDWPDEKLIDFPKQNWIKHSHEWAAFGTIQNVIKEEAIVDVLVLVIDRRVLAAILERLIKNIYEFRRGMPDLLVWNLDERTCKFVEVKGEGDRLSIYQQLWLQYLKQVGASIEVCNVHSMGSKRKKKSKTATEKETDVNEDLLEENGDN